METMTRYFEKPGSLITADATGDDKISPQGADNFSFSEAEAAEPKEQKADKDAEEAGDDDGDESEDDDDELFDEDGNELDVFEPDIHRQTVDEALPAGFDSTDIIADTPALTKALEKRRILYNFNTGWAAGWIKRIYAKPKGPSKFNVEVQYDTESGRRDQKLELPLYGHGSDAPLSCWVLLKQK